MNHKHGWFSKKQLNQNKVLYYYKNVEGEEAVVTEVKSNKDNSYFNDAVYVGIVTDFIKRVDTNGDFIPINYINNNKCPEK